MRRSSEPVYASMFLCVVVLSGCFAPAIEPGAVGDVADSLPFFEGWSHSTPDASFSYQGGVFRAAYLGDQVVLRVSSEEPMRLGRMWWELEGVIPPEEDRSWPVLFAAWNEAEPWPRWARAGHFVQEVASIGLGSAGASQDVEDPQLLFADLVMGGTNGTYGWRLELADPLVLDSGTWRLWFAVPGSKEMEVRVGIPQVPLASAPLASEGCERLKPSDFASDVTVYAAVLGAVYGAEWTVDLRPGETLLGYLMQTVGTRAREMSFAFPDGEMWRESRLPGNNSVVEPQGWDLSLASTMSGEHHLKIEHEAQLSISSGRTGLYCVI